MAVSGSFDFTLNRDALITRALRKIGAIASGQTPTANEISDGSDELNLILKAWQADGMQLWTVTQASVTPVKGQEVYTMGSGGDINVARPEDILEVYRRLTADTFDVPLRRKARADFFRLPDKASEGTPTHYYFDPQLDLAKLYIWNTASTDFAANYTLEVLYQRPFDDMDATADTLAFPQSWELAVVLALTHNLAMEYGKPASDVQSWEKQMEKEKKRQMDWDTEHESIYFGVDMQATNYGPR